MWHIVKMYFYVCCFLEFVICIYFYICQLVNVFLTTDQLCNSYMIYHFYVTGYNMGVFFLSDRKVVFL